MHGVIHMQYTKAMSSTVISHLSAFYFSILTSDNVLPVKETHTNRSVFESLLNICPFPCLCQSENKTTTGAETGGNRKEDTSNYFGRQMRV